MCYIIIITKKQLVIEMTLKYGVLVVGEHDVHGVNQNRYEGHRGRRVEVHLRKFYSTDKIKYGLQSFLLGIPNLLPSILAD